MPYAQVKFFSWDKIYFFQSGQLDLKIGDLVLAEHSFGPDAGEVMSWKREEEVEVTEEVKAIIRKLTIDDVKLLREQQQRKPQVFKQARELIKKHHLEIKLIDIHFSFDGQRLMFIFTAAGRVDFRELLKDLTKQFNKIIRLQQIGPRDETREISGVGTCGRPLCCSSWLQELVSVTTDLAKMQQVAHRGSDRLSGVCGRLKCCLSYELKVYEQCCQDFPPLGSLVKTSFGSAEVLEWSPLKQTVRVKIIEGENKSDILEVAIGEIKK